ncbi:ribonuclease [Bifidobacterium panos]|uniref:Oligoribonuclease n=1 Tax=Bifidobacterium panos TaxID=2675321 RepID=A0ABX1SXZ8_9BIFI|nr:ribonuclease [Bifidobacterium sp. DSM 109963]NMN02721.1 oligoribonuclease [Bifidobacterium sp. DSM 109963]
MSCDKKEERLLWIDVETTAIDPDDGDLLEVGMVLTDMRGKLLENPRYWLVKDQHSIRINAATITAIGMHWENNLIKEVCALEACNGLAVSKEIRETLDKWSRNAVLHPAGTNVDFDLRWLAAHLGLHTTLDKLSHRKLDLTTLRLLDTAIGLDPYESHATYHRVEDCLARDLAEYWQRIEQMFDKDTPGAPDTTANTTKTLRSSPAGGCE